MTTDARFGEPPALFRCEFGERKPRRSPFLRVRGGTRPPSNIRSKKSLRCGTISPSNP
jgi:hypothetical protein